MNASHDWSHDFTCGVSVLRAARADSRMGRATASSASHSSLMALAAMACLLATSSSAFTIYTNREEDAET